MTYANFKQLAITIVILILAAFFVGELTGCSAYDRQGGVHSEELMACKQMCAPADVSSYEKDRCICGTNWEKYPKGQKVTTCYTGLGGGTNCTTEIK